MTSDEYTAFLEASIPEYAAEKVKAGSWTAVEALEKSRKAHDDLLPQGAATSGQHLYTILDGNKGIGWVWMSGDSGAAGGSGFIFDLFVESEYRRRGVAERAMLLLEEEARRMKIGRLSLHVFGNNSPARTLYTKLGYKETDVSMAKEIE